MILSLCARYGTSFIEQVSLTHISPWLGGGDAAEGNGAAGGGAAGAAGAAGGNGAGGANGVGGGANPVRTHKKVAH